jgi:peptide/nickel transport system ATP-binding protein
MSELRFDRVSVRYGTHRSGLTAVDDVSLVVPSGSVVGLVGESGSGKSTLARAAIGLAPISGGAITLDGADVRTLRRRRPIQMVFQDPFSSLDPRMSIGESIAEAMPRSLRGGAARRARVAELLEMVSLDPERAGSLPAALSGGQRQRIALARALAADPEVVIADEITSALDVSVQGSVLNLVRELRRELSLTMLFISHNLAVVRYLSDHLAVMYLGRIVEFGPTEQVLADPQHPYTRELPHRPGTATCCARATPRRSTRNRRTRTPRRAGAASTRGARSGRSRIRIGRSAAP